MTYFRFAIFNAFAMGCFFVFMIASALSNETRMALFNVVMIAVNLVCLFHNGRAVNDLITAFTGKEKHD